VTRIRDGVLIVHCDSAPRAQQLQLDSDRIKEKLNERLDGNFIKDIRATSGRFGRGRPDPTIAETDEEPLPSPAELAQLQVPQQDVDFIRALAEKTGDEGLQRQFSAAMTNFCRLQQWRRAQGYRPCPECGRLLAPDNTCLVCHPGRIPQQGNPDFDESYESNRGGYDG
jgi:predicted nucleic acid-binding Zn ribbon protein